MPRQELSIPPKVFCGQRERFSAATDVEFINDELLASIAFNSRTLYQISISPADNTYEIVSQQKVKHAPDTMDYKDGMLVTSDFPYQNPHGYASIYRRENNELKFIKEIQIDNTKAHGATIIDDNNIIITSNSDHNRGLLFIDIRTNKMNNFNNFNLYPKDTCIHDGKLFITCSGSLPLIDKKVKVLDSVLYIFDLATLEKIDEMPFHGQTDSLDFDGEDGFITLQSHDTLLHFKFINNKLNFVRFIDGFYFPHGVSIHNNKVAVTNYGDNSIHVYQKSELVQ